MRLPASSRTSRSLPWILIELAPLTPESASSTLSRMYCEKLKLIDGNSWNFSVDSSSISSRVILHRQSSCPSSFIGTVRHSSMGRKGARTRG